jgi:hypothetical protein
MSLCCNNKVAINIAHNPVQHGQIKHIRSDGHFMKEKLYRVDLYTLCEDRGATCIYFNEGSVY